MGEYGGGGGASIGGEGGTRKTDLHSVTKKSTRLIRPPRAVDGKVVFCQL